MEYKKTLLSILLSLIVCSLPSVAQQNLKFSVVSFGQDKSDKSALDSKLGKVDGSGSRYAIIKVSSKTPGDNLNEYKFDFGNLMSTTVERDGVLWVYVQKNAKMVTISRKGYRTIHRYDLGTTIKEGKNYVMTLSSEIRVVSRQLVQFNVKPAGMKAVVMVDKTGDAAQEELFGITGASGSVSKSLEYGTYNYRVLSDNNNILEGSFTINDNTKTHVVNVTVTDTKKEKETVQQNKEFSVVSFGQDPFDTSARDAKHAKKDDNGDKYSIIKVTSSNPDDNIKDYEFDFGAFKHLTIEREGVLWVYVQKNAQHVNITKKGLSDVLKYDLQLKVESGRNYVMTIASAKRAYLTQIVQFNIKPIDAKAIITVRSSKHDAKEEMFGITDAAGSVARSLEYGTYTYKVLSDKYNTSEGRFTLNDKTKTHVENVTLASNFAEIAFSVDFDADIYVNGEKKGNRKWNGSLRAGTYKIECCKTNYKSSVKYITVEANKNQTFKLQNPVPILSNINITSSPTGADIFIDGKEYGKTPQSIEMMIGKHEVILSKTDYKSEMKNIELSENQMDLNVRLSRSANMSIHSNPSDAALYIDNKFVGKTPVKTDLESGDYTIKLVKKQYKTLEKRVHVDSSKPVLTFDMSKLLIEKTTFYGGVNALVGTSMGVGANIGGYINNINVEAGATYLLGKEQVYNNTTTPTLEELTGISFGLKVGYGIMAGPKIRITPQLGVNMLMIDGDAISSKDVCLTVGARCEYAFSSHMGVSLTPEAQFAVSKDDTGNVLNEISSKVKNMLSCFGVRVGIFFNL